MIMNNTGKMSNPTGRTYSFIELNFLLCYMHEHDVETFNMFFFKCEGKAI